MKPNGTKEKILKEGRSLLQKHGYNGFSFQDIADLIEIKKPSLYDHFASKEELVIAILKNYSFMFTQWAESISYLSPLERIRKVFDVFYSFTADKRKVCPVLSLTADTHVLSRSIQKEMQDFVDHWLQWLELQIHEGQKNNEIRTDLDAATLSTFIYSQGMGSQFQARIKNDPQLTLSSGDMIVAFIKNNSKSRRKGK